MAKENNFSFFLKRRDDGGGGGGNDFDGLSISRSDLRLSTTKDS